MASALREGCAPSRAFMGTLWPLPVGVQYEAGVQARGDGDLDQGGSHVDKRAVVRPKIGFGGRAAHAEGETWRRKGTWRNKVSQGLKSRWGRGIGKNFDGRVFQAVEQQVPGVSTEGVTQIAGGQSTGVTGPATNTHQVPLHPPKRRAVPTALARPCGAREILYWKITAVSI